MISTQLASHQLTGYAYNASGINNQILSQLKKIADSGSGAITLKSATMEQREGNPNPKYDVKSDLIPGCTLNSMGLPNEGIVKTLEFVKELKEYSNKPIIVSLSGLSLDENLRMPKIPLDKAWDLGLGSTAKSHFSKVILIFCLSIFHHANTHFASPMSIFIVQEASEH